MSDAGTSGGNYWFKPKRHGYGATPTNWKGWLATFAFAVAMAVVSLFWLLGLPEEHKLLGTLVWALAMLGAVWQFTAFCKKKTDGDWAWRWNGKPYKEMLEEKAREQMERQAGRNE